MRSFRRTSYAGDAKASPSRSISEVMKLGLLRLSKWKVITRFASNKWCFVDAMFLVQKPRAANFIPVARPPSLTVAKRTICAI
jgi:hypothetical protein